MWKAIEARLRLSVDASVSTTQSRCELKEIAAGKVMTGLRMEGSKQVERRKGLGPPNFPNRHCCEISTEVDSGVMRAASRTKMVAEANEAPREAAALSVKETRMCLALLRESAEKHKIVAGDGKATKHQCV